MENAGADVERGDPPIGSPEYEASFIDSDPGKAIDPMEAPERIETIERLGMTGQIDERRRARLGLDSPMQTFDLRVLEAALPVRVPIRDFDKGPLDQEALDKIDQLQEVGYTVEAWQDHDVAGQVVFVAWTGRPQPGRVAPSAQPEVQYFLITIGEPPNWNRLTETAIRAITLVLRPQINRGIAELTAFNESLKDEIVGYLIGRRPVIGKTVGVYA